MRLNLLFFLVLICTNTNAEAPFTLNANNIEYENNTIKASGNVEIVSDDGSLWADNLTYNTADRTILASGNVLFMDKNNIAIFIDKINLNENFSTGVITSLKARLGKNGPALTATSAKKTSSTIFELNNATYSPCTVCKESKNPAWQVRAGKITYDAESKNIVYRNAFLDIYGMPVLYTPYFRHSTNTEKPQSGLLPPKFGNSTNRGLETTLSYYYRPSPFKDYTFRSRLMSKRGAMFIGEHRFLTKNASGEIKGSFISDDNTSELRSHFKAEAEYVVSSGKRLGINGEFTSDETYLDDFFNRNPAYLPSTIYAEAATKDHYYAANATFYHDQRDGQDAGQTIQQLPRLQAERVFKVDNVGGQLTINGDMQSLYRGEGTRTQRVIAQANYNAPYTTQKGHIFNLDANLRTDIYHVDSTAINAPEGTTIRVLPQIALKWEKPYISPNKNHKITPKVMLITAPNGGNPENRIPNEDSVAYELDTTNLFDTNRFAGFDRVESGTRFIYGLDNSWGGATKDKWQLFFGQSYRFSDDSILPTGSGTGTKISDWVGEASFQPNKWFSFANRFRLDNADFTARRLDTSMQVGELDHSYARITHTMLDGGPEEVSAEAKIELSDTWDAKGAFRRDMTGGGKLLLSEGSIVYNNQCYTLSFTARRRGFENRSVPPSTDYLVNLELLTLGRTEKLEPKRFQ